MLKTVRPIKRWPRYALEALNGIPRPGARAAALVRSDRKARRGRAPIARQFDDLGAPPAHRDRRGAAPGLVRDVVPAQDRPQAQMPGRRRGAGAHPASRATACCCPAPSCPASTDGSIARLTEHALIAALTQLVDVRARPASTCISPSTCRCGVLLQLPIAELVDAAPAEVRALARHHPRSDRGPDRARHRSSRRRSPTQLRVSGITDRDRRFRRRLFLVLEPARVAVRRAQARQQLREELRHRRHQRRDLPDRDRSRPPLRQRRGRRGHRECRRPAGAAGDGLRLRPGRADRPADAAGALPRPAAPAREQAAAAGVRAAEQAAPVAASSIGQVA